MYQKTSKTIIASLLVMFGLALAPLAVNVSAADQKLNCGVDIGSCTDDGADTSQGEGQADNLAGSGGIFETVTNILLFLIGAIAVIMLVVGGIRYVISGGDQNQVTAAKNTIMYAIIGIVVAIIAYAVVQFVITSFN